MQQLGERIRYWRKRRNGMSQTALAGLAGVSQAYVSQVETGLVTIERRSTLNAIAAALQVTVSDLIGEPDDSPDPHRKKAAAAIPGIRVALAELESSPAGAAAVTKEEFFALLHEAGKPRLRCDYAAVAPRLTPLITLSGSLDPECRARVLSATAATMRSLGYRDLAWRAADMAYAQAQTSGLPWLIGPIQFTRLTCLPQEARAARTAAATTTLEILDRHSSDVRALRGYGALHLSAALNKAAQRDSSTDTVNAHLEEAQAVAQRLGEPDPEDGHNGISMDFGPANVSLWRMSIAIEQGEPSKAIEIAQATDVSALEALPHRNRISSYWLDYGRALASIGDRDRQAIALLARAESAAPQLIRFLPAARETVAMMIARAKKRAVAEDLSRLASKMGLL